MEDKRQQRELQEQTQKGLEAISGIAGSSLEQTTWLRKNFAVKPGPQTEAEEDEADMPDDFEHDIRPDTGNSAKSPAAVRRNQVLLDVIRNAYLLVF